MTTSTRVGLLHPGEMGASVGASGRHNGHRVLWVSEGRGDDTRRRAAAAGLEDVSTLAKLVAASDVVLSVCPPHAALDVAGAVAVQRFRGLYVDGNAVSPATARSIARVVQAGGATYVDGGIIGPPPVKPGTTRLYLSGQVQTAQDVYYDAAQGIPLLVVAGIFLALLVTSFIVFGVGFARLHLMPRLPGIGYAVSGPLFAVVGFALDNWIQSVAALLMTASAAWMVIALRRSS